MKIGILNSGGDCPGLNAVIHGVVGAAAELGWEVVGFRDGFEGLLPPGDFMMLKPEDTVGILKMGGTILGTTNKGHFAAKIGEGEISGVPKEIVAKAKATMDQMGIGALVVVGGDGSLTTGMQLYNEGWPIIGVPKTIDNDLQATAMTFGFDSAVSTVVDGLDRLHTTAASHKRVMVLEVMGRHAGWIALRFLDDPETAATHFTRIQDVTRHPTSHARSHYWLGRVAEALHQPQQAPRDAQRIAQSRQAFRMDEPAREEEDETELA